MQHKVGCEIKGFIEETKEIGLREKTRRVSEINQENEEYWFKQMDNSGKEYIIQKEKMKYPSRLVHGIAVKHFKKKQILKNLRQNFSLICMKMDWS